MHLSQLQIGALNIVQCLLSVLIDSLDHDLLLLDNCSESLEQTTDVVENLFNLVNCLVFINVFGSLQL